MPDPSLPCVLVFEPVQNGHQLEYVMLLLERLATDQPALELVLAVPPALAVAVRARLSAGARALLQTQELTPDEIRRSTAGPLWRRGFSRWNILQRAIARAGADAAYVLHLDLLQAPLALGLSGRAPMGGILFRPSIHYGRCDIDQGSGPSRLRRLLKRLLLQRAVRNPALRSMATLDELFVESAHVVLPSFARVCHLPEPLPAPPEHADVPHWIGELPRTRTCFVLPGVLARRKGIFEVLAALELLSPAEAGGVCVVFAGRLSDEDRATFRARLATISRSVPDAHVHLEDRFLSDTELAALVARADVALLPYQQFVGSSGLLYRAAQAGRPSIAPRYGLMGWLARRHRLGLTVDTARPQALAEALRRCLSRSAAELCDPDGLARFARTAGDARFAKALLGDITRLVNDL